jgi:hypothetical protein
MQHDNTLNPFIAFYKYCIFQLIFLSKHFKIAEKIINHQLTFLYGEKLVKNANNLLKQMENNEWIPHSFNNKNECKIIKNKISGLMLSFNNDTLLFDYDPNRYSIHSNCDYTHLNTLGELRLYVWRLGAQKIYFDSVEKAKSEKQLQDEKILSEKNSLIENINY